ncbi:TetR/AcrR family transcriptional regulator [Pseudenhygromyxa sp. WMMC2535]|uniref:TetR/AcrR family transcriptional regulator n=1 Tax=Pseudenhygromyxa sp. WMMC2535 TaxID=2712867 RepID=UPI0015521E32|nr:TetR/AcrR family transcriptional regulator [Pseudenhygromyxa sp. WMMC2535]NVB42465.1 TetR/AcrR family transcriptional regulator [Pseudenhygromyxa sp. WMMC2535]
MFVPPRNAPLTRADVVAAAERLLVEDGADALSMRRLAAALGTSYQVVYSRVGDKAAVTRALHDEGFARLTACGEASIERARADGLRPAQILVELGRAYLNLAASHPALFDVMFGVPIPDFTRDEAARAVAREGFRRTWIVATRIWLDEHYPTRPRRAASRLAWRLWTAVHGITVLHIAGHECPSGDAGREIEGVINRLLVDPPDL